MKYNLLLLIALILVVLPAKGHVIDEEGAPSSSTNQRLSANHSLRAPLYWSVYEHCWLKEKAGEQHIDITQAQWDSIINWVATNLKPYGYEMICTDGFIPMLAENGAPYMTRYGSITLKELIKKCKAKGLKVGVYDNPLWIHGDDSVHVRGTKDVTIGDLRYRSSDKVLHKDTTDRWFSWVVATRPGAKAYIDGFFKHYHDLGVDFIRMDFLSWYEDGFDRNMGRVGRGYGRDSYALALQYICEAARKYGVFTSLVMPHLYEKAMLEARYGNMIRVVADTGDGGWKHFSAAHRGQFFPTWPNYDNMFDGFIYWSSLSGRDKIILDGDFTRLNTFANANEMESVISLQLLAGGPIAVADCPSSIGNRVSFYQNKELLRLNKERFVGKPLSVDHHDVRSQIWAGKLTDGSWIIGFFNREDTPQVRQIDFRQLGLKGKWHIRDMWKHTDERPNEAYQVTLAPHACKVIHLTKAMKSR